MISPDTWSTVIIFIGGIAVNIGTTAAVVSYKMGQREAIYKERQKNTIKDIQELHKIISLNNNEHERNLKEVATELKNFRLKVAKELGVNGD